MGKMYKNVLQLTLYKLFRKREYINVVVPAIQSSHTLSRPPFQTRDAFRILFFYIFRKNKSSIESASSIFGIFPQYLLLFQYSEYPALLQLTLHGTGPASRWKHMLFVEWRR